MYKKLKSICFFIVAIIIVFSGNFAHAKTTLTTQMNFIRCGSTVYFGITVCPQVQAAITGWTNVTTALDATGTGTRIDVGGGNNDHADLSTLDPGNLTPGSVINIYHRATPYSSKLAFFTDGTEQNPIVINGVTDANGNRAEIDCAGATTVHPEDWSTLYGSPYGCWMLSYTRDLDYDVVTNNGPSWMTFKNLKMYGAKSDEFYDVDQPYVGGVPPIRVANGEHFIFQGNIFIDNDNGLFFASNYAIDHAEIRGNYFAGNGTVGSYLHHNLYLQAVSSDPSNPNVVEGNYFGPLRAGAIGMSGPKMRGSNYVMRYNTVTCFQRCMDIVESQDSLPAWIYANFTAQEILDYYRTSYVYGNQFYTSESDIQVSSPIHIGMDTTEVAPDDQTFNACCAGAGSNQPMARGYGAPVYFYHNSIYVNANSSYTMRLFDLDAGSGGASRYFGEVVAANNIWQMLDSAGTVYINHALYTGTINYQGVNQLHAPNAVDNAIYDGIDLNDDPDITIVGSLTTSFTSANDPLFTNVSSANDEAVDLSLGAGSPAINAAGSLPAALSTYPVLFQPVNAASGGGAVNRSSTNNLGAYE